MYLDGALVPKLPHLADSFTMDRLLSNLESTLACS